MRPGHRDAGAAARVPDDADQPFRGDDRIERGDALDLADAQQQHAGVGHLGLVQHLGRDVRRLDPMTQAEKAAEPLVLHAERGQTLSRVGRGVALDEQRLEPGAAPASRLGLLLEPDERGEHGLPEPVGDAEGDPFGREERGHREHHAAGEENGVTTAEASVRRGEHP